MRTTIYTLVREDYTDNDSPVEGPSIFLEHYLAVDMAREEMRKRLDSAIAALLEETKLTKDQLMADNLVVDDSMCASVYSGDYKLRTRMTIYTEKVEMLENVEFIRNLPKSP